MSKAVIVLAAERLARGDSEGALLLLDRAEVADVKNIGVQIFKLVIFERTGELKQAEALLHKLIEAYPQEPGLRRQLVSSTSTRSGLMTQSARFAHLPIPDRAILKPRSMSRVTSTGQGTGRGAPGAAARSMRAERCFPFQIALAELISQRQRQRRVSCSNTCGSVALARRRFLRRSNLPKCI